MLAANNISHKNLAYIGFSIILILVLIMLWPREEAIAPTPVIEQAAYIPPPPAAKAVSPIRFVDITDSTGIDYRHYNGASMTADGKPTRYMPETMGPGVALLDFDRDGDLDVFVSNSSSFDKKTFDKKRMSPRLYRNEGEMRFSDVTAQAGLDIVGYGMGVAVADYNADAYPDLLLTGWGGSSLYRNNGNGTFSDVTQKALPELRPDGEAPDWSTGAVFFDADKDGDLDIYIANYVQWTPGSDVFSTMDGKNKSYAVPKLYRGGSSRLLLQDNGKFIDATAQAGMLNDEGKSLGATLWDFNNDGLLDIAVANDTQPNFLYYNLGGGRFENRALEAGIAYDENGGTRAGMGIDVADVGNDGHVCIAIGNFSREPVSVFRAESGEFFREATQNAGVAEASYLVLTFGIMFADFDLDGWQDLILANGHIEPEIQNIESEISYRQQMVLLGNKRNAQFENWSESAGEVFQQKWVARGLAVGDLDLDGDLDVVVTENNGPLHVLRNEANLDARNYLRVSLQGVAPNRDAIGAKLELVGKDGQFRQQRMVKGGSSYLSQSELTQTFGLSSQHDADKLIVTWPSGQRSEYPVDEINRTLVLVEDSAPAVAGILKD